MTPEEEFQERFSEVPAVKAAMVDFERVLAAESDKLAAEVGIGPPYITVKMRVEFRRRLDSIQFSTKVR
jgi:hypothetical protein